MRLRSAVNRRGGRMFVWATAVCLVACLAIAHYGILAKSKSLFATLDAGCAIIDLSSGKYAVSPAVASSKYGCEPFESMIGRLKPYAAICGTYYDPDWKPLGDIVIKGKVICRGNQRQGIGFTSNGKIKFMERTGRSRFDWKGCVSGIACGPRLIRHGRKDINVRRDGFSAAAATNIAARCAVGATSSGKLILCSVAEPITLSTLADVMLELGAVDAVNMDGGSMCALYKDGKYLVTPAKSMSNILAVYRVK